MKKKRWLLSVFIAIFLLPFTMAPVFAQAGTTTSSNTTLQSDTVEEFLDTFFNSPDITAHYIGASIVIVQGDEVLAQKGYGYADLESEREVDPEHTVFRIASVSKTFTALAIMQLVEQGKIGLEANIEQYLGDIVIDNPYEQPVTVAHLLTHRSGFRVTDPLPEDIHDDFERFVSIEEYVRQHMPPVVRKPGEAYMYDNFAYLLLGYIVENVSGLPYETYVQQHIFDPIGMERSGFLLEGDLLANLTTGYDVMGGPHYTYVLTPTIMPHGGMLATPDDMRKFMQAFLSDLNGQSNILLSSASAREMLQYRSSIHSAMPDTTYGFEATPQLPGAGSHASLVYKVGDLPGNSSYLMFMPEHNIGIFLTYNKIGALRELFHEQWIQTFFPEYATPWTVDPIEPYSIEQLERFTGLYSDLRLPSLVHEISAVEDGTLLISDVYLGPRPLYQLTETLFYDELTGRFTAFQVDEEGNARYLKEPYINPLGYAKRGEKAVGFADVSADHPFATSIFALQSLGYFPNDASVQFEPERALTRGEIVKQLMEVSNVKPADVGDASEYAFRDIVGHRYADYIQIAHQIGMIQGDGEGRFEPDRIVTRQEVAVMIWNLLRLQYADEWFAQTVLEGETAPWAIPAVKMIVSLGLHGPDVESVVDGEGIDYRSKDPMLHQEAAALYYQLFVRPIDSIAMQYQQALAEQQLTDQELLEQVGNE